MSGICEEASVWRDCKAQRTKAFPDHTLFGSTMERQQDCDLEQLKRIDVKKDFVKIVEKPPKRRRPELTLPPGIKERLPGDFLLDQKRSTLMLNKDQQERATALLDFLEHKSKYYELQVRGTQGGLRAASSRPELAHKHRVEDLYHAKEMNLVGMNERDYNRDKHRRPGSQHQYSFLGSPFYKGMDFNTDFKSYTKPQLEQVTIPPRRHMSYRPPAGNYRTENEEIEKQLPRNILHKFGTRNCRTFLQPRTSSGSHSMRSPSAYSVQGSLVSRAERVESAINGDHRQADMLRNEAAPGSQLLNATYAQEAWDRPRHDPEALRYQRYDISL